MQKRKRGAAMNQQFQAGRGGTVTSQACNFFSESFEASPAHCLVHLG